MQAGSQMGAQLGTQINEVRRELGSRVVEAREAMELTISQTYDAEPADVWAAVTDPERIPRWFLPVSGELSLGGRYQLEGNAGGTVTACDPPHGFDATWEFGGGVSWIEVRLVAEPDGRTRFTLTHLAHPEEHWATYGPGAVGIGWDLGILGLARHLGSGVPAPDPAAGPAWMASAEGRAYSTASGEAWYAAHVAAGQDAATARAAADRAIAAYTAAG